jgi:pimeloyl-CoA dehydrogenase
MDLKLTSDQRQIEDSVTRLLADRYGFAERRSIASRPPGWSASLWTDYAQLGLLAILTPSDHGGLDGGATDLLPVMSAFGRFLVLEPYLASAVLSTAAIAGSTNGAARRELLPPMAAGHHRAAFAHEEPGVPLDRVRLSAVHTSEGWELTGCKCAVLHFAGADSLVVSARAHDGADGTALFSVRGRASGVTRRDFQLIDQRGFSDLEFSRTPATLLMGPSRAAIEVLRRTLALGTAALCAEAVGAMRAALVMTTQYLATRVQFGRPLSANQVLRHRCAEMQVATETCEAMAYLAAVAVDMPDSTEGDRDLARAKLLIGQHGRSVGEQAVQLHGGIGMTDECAVGHYLQRLTTIDSMLGNQDSQLDRLLAG